MELPESAFLIVIIRFGEYTGSIAKDTRRILMGIRTGGLPAYINEQLEDVEFTPNLYALLRSPVEGIKRSTGGLAIYHYRVKNKPVKSLLDYVREYLDERIKKSKYLSWKSYDFMVARWL